MEYRESTFLSSLKQNGILPHRSCPNTSQQNGRAEHKHRHILDTVRTLLLYAFIPEHFWGEVALTSVYTINKVPSPTTFNRSSYELLYDSITNPSTSLVVSVLCFIRLMNAQN
jgi:hypothetical protein